MTFSAIAPPRAAPPALPTRNAFTNKRFRWVFPIVGFLVAPTVLPAGVKLDHVAVRDSQISIKFANRQGVFVLDSTLKPEPALTVPYRRTYIESTDDGEGETKIRVEPLMRDGRPSGLEVVIDNRSSLSVVGFDGYSGGTVQARIEMLVTVSNIAETVSIGGRLTVPLDGSLGMSSFGIYDENNDPRFVKTIRTIEGVSSHIIRGSATLPPGTYLLSALTNVFIDRNSPSSTTVVNATVEFESELELAPAPAPEIIGQPLAVTVSAGEPTSFSVEVAEPDGATYQWFRDGVPIAGANESIYALPSVQPLHAGEYSVSVTAGKASTTSDAATLTVTPHPPSMGRLISLSSRALTSSGDDVAISGFVISGSGMKRLLIRAAGPSLAADPFNLKGTVADPRLTLTRRNGTTNEVIAVNDNWRDNPAASGIAFTGAALGAFPLTSDLDAALLEDLPSGEYSAVVDGNNAGTGIAIVEIYEVEDGSDAILQNLSTRGFSESGDGVMIVGFVVSGEGVANVLLRVVGPTLAENPFNLSSTVADPQLTLYKHEPDGTQTLIVRIDDWGLSPDSDNTRDTAADVFAFPLIEGGTDAAAVVTLRPGIYSVVGSGLDPDDAGTIIVEAYRVD